MERTEPKVWTTPTKVALGCAIASTAASITFGVLSEYYAKGAFQTTAVLLGGTSAAIFGISFEPLWAAWKRREVADLKAKGKKTPKLLNSEKIALALFITSGVFGAFFSVVAIKNQSALFGTIAGASAALFGISAEPLWRAWSRHEGGNEGKKKVGQIALIMAISTTALWLLSNGSGGTVAALVAGTSGALFGISFEPIWRAKKVEEVEALGEKEVPLLLPSEKLALVIMASSIAAAALFTWLSIDYKLQWATALAGVSGALFGVAPEPLWRAWGRYDKKEERVEALLPPPSLLDRDVID